MVREVGKPVAGKTGTTNDEKDVWFVGFSPDIAVGVYLGYDKPRQIGNRATGGGLAAPIVKDFLKVALADKPAVPFRVPPGLKLIRIDPKSGMRIAAGSPGGLLEAFKPGTAPPDSYSVIGYQEGDRPLATRSRPTPIAWCRPRAGCTEPRSRRRGLLSVGEASHSASRAIAS